MNDGARASEADAALDAFVARFHAALVTRREWTHGAHLEVGAWHVHHLGAERALDRLRDGIRRLNEHHGTPNTDASGYHETITRAYVFLLSEFLARCDRAAPLAERLQRLLASPLAVNTLLLTFWSKDVLFSARARNEWVAPDVAPLRLPDDAP